MHKLYDPNCFEYRDDIPDTEEAIQLNLISRADVSEPVAIDFTPELITPDQEYIPSAEEYKAAFIAVEPDITDTQRAMLKAHYHAPNYTVSATELANAVGYNSFQTANAQYGTLARLVGDNIYWPNRNNHITLYILVDFVPPNQNPKKQWLWILHPQVVQALNELQWF